MQHKQDMANVQSAEAVHKQRIFSATEQAAFIQKLMHSDAEHSQKMSQTAQAAKQQAKKPEKGNNK